MRISDWSSDVCSSDLALGNVAELATANLWIAKDGVAVTPAPNGTFLNGITKQRAMQLLTAAGIEVRETRLTWQDVLEADEVFSTGNYGKVLPVTQVEDRNLQPGPIYATAREAYWTWPHGGRSEEHTSELQSLMRI